MNGLDLLILLALTAGHTELLVTIVNRSHSFPLRRDVLKHVRHLHDLLVPLFPLILVGQVGFRSPGVLIGGSWFDLSWGWKCYLGLCLLGAIGLVFSTLRWQWTRSPTLLLDSRHRRIDIAQTLGFRPLADGPHHWLARAPLNEIFQLDLSEKEFRHPNLPPEWDGLSILHLTDLHFVGTVDRPYFEQVADLAAEQQADLIVFTGDLLDRQDLVDWLPTTLGKLSAPLGCYFILGNHDWYLDSEETRNRLTDLGWFDVGSRTVTIKHAGKTLSLGGTEVPWMGTHPDFSTAPDEAFRLLLSHTPDHLAWASRQNIDVMLSGHNHGGQVVLPLIGPVYSPSRFGCRYASGTFWQSPTLLHVSRGISAKHPLRWRCPPEVAKLVLRSGPVPK